MNLGQCIDPEWVQARMPQRHALPPRAHTPVLRIVTRDSNRVTVVQQRGANDSKPQDFDRDPFLKVPTAPKAAAPLPARSLPAPVVKRSNYKGGRRRTADNPWPRGRRGTRFNTLTQAAGMRKPTFSLAEIRARLGDLNSSQVQMCLKGLVHDKYLDRTGTPKLYRYAITEAGRKALEVGA